MSYELRPQLHNPSPPSLSGATQPSAPCHCPTFLHVWGLCVRVCCVHCYCILLQRFVRAIVLLLACLPVESARLGGAPCDGCHQRLQSVRQPSPHNQLLLPPGDLLLLLWPAKTTRQWTEGRWEGLSWRRLWWVAVSDLQVLRDKLDSIRLCSGTGLSNSWWGIHRPYSIARRCCRLAIAKSKIKFWYDM